jgi:hypothetical protein
VINQRRWCVATLALVAACSESARTPTDPGPTPNQPVEPDRVFWARGRGPTLPLGVMTFHGGAVLVASKTFAIYWGSDWNTPSFAGDKITGLTSFLQGWNGSAYAGALTEYSGQNGQITAASTFLGSVIDPSTAPSADPGDAALIAEVASLVPIPDPETLYLIYVPTPRGTAPFCGFHTFGTYKRHPVQIAWFFNLDGDAGCDPHDTFTTHSQGLSALANVTAHELAETITDPRLLGWYAMAGTGEIGDKCAFVFGANTVTFPNSTTWHVQSEWSNQAYNAATGALNRNQEPGCVSG